MAASIGLINIRILIFQLLYYSYFLSDFDWVCGRLHGLIWACMSDSLAFNVAISFNKNASTLFLFPPPTQTETTVMDIKMRKSINSLPASSEFCHLLNNLDPIGHNVGLTWIQSVSDTLMVSERIFQKSWFRKNQQTTKRHAKLWPVSKELILRGLRSWDTWMSCH